MDDYKFEEHDDILSRELVLSERGSNIENLSHAEIEKIMEKTILFRINQIKSTNPNEVFAGIDTIKNILNETKMIAIIELLISMEIDTLLIQKLISFGDFDRIVASSCDLIISLTYFATEDQINKIISQELFDVIFNIAKSYLFRPEAHNCFRCIYSIICINTQFCSELIDRPFFHNLLEYQDDIAQYFEENISMSKPHFRKQHIRAWGDVFSIISLISEYSDSNFSEDTIFQFLQIYLLPIQMNINSSLNLISLKALIVVFKFNIKYCTQLFIETNAIQLFYPFLENSNQKIVDSTLSLILIMIDEECDIDIPTIISKLFLIIEKYTWIIATDVIIKTFDILAKLASYPNLHEALISTDELLPNLSAHIDEAPFEVRDAISRFLVNFILAQNEESLKALLCYPDLIFSLIEYLHQIDNEPIQTELIINALSITLSYLNNTGWKLITKDAMEDAIDQELIEELMTDESLEISLNAKRIYTILSGE